ncbi:MAG TPA: hypothetical protein VND66_11070 [Acidobacteriaceae bacterium]|nr:hypothetical protein [Terriglobia bacterium]HVC91148.1 hypothetical protein [Acidobacteriaceae bacterium]
MNRWKRALGYSLGAVALAVFSLSASASQLATESQAAVPQDVQQLIVVDYQAMENSDIAMKLRAKVLPPELKRLQDALQHSGMNVNQSVTQLTFASYRVPGDTSSRIVGIASGQFPVQEFLDNFKKQHVKGTQVRNETIYPMGNTGLSVTFLDQTTMIFGSLDAIRNSLDARDGITPSFLTNTAMQNLMPVLQNEAVWSILDQKGTQEMMKSVLGQAAQVADFSTVKNSLIGSRYTMDFNQGVNFSLDVVTPDTMTAATMSSLMGAASLFEKMNATPTEQQAIDATNINSSGNVLQVRFAASDDQFASLLNSQLFQSVIH